ncbi:unnamed protein product [Brachionus calyciflorus]|uniref:Uncharacterized protein n=1 Tax=Brachionus calyciflorus TaxID=104777 RepID=A0A813M8D5_9BILA|nr:unnamed protein product [Brachionus calyciflorus]
MDSDSDYDDCPGTTLVEAISDDLISKYQIQFHFDKANLRSILEEVVINEKLKFSCICGGYFTKFNGQITSADIYIFTSNNYVQSEAYLNMFLNENFRRFDFKQLGTVAPPGVLAIKKVVLANGKQAVIHFTSINFPRSKNHRVQLLNTYDLESCKIIYSYNKNCLECSDWFFKGGSLISENKLPTQEFLNKYRQKGFRFVNNFFKPESNIYQDLNNFPN